LAQLREEVEKQRTRVDEAGAELAAIRVRDGIIDPDPDSFNASLNTPERNIVMIEQQLSEQRFLVTRLRGELEQIEKLKPEELKEALRTLRIEDQTVMKMIANLQEAASDEARLFSSGLGENHPRIRALRSQREIFTEQLSGQLNSVRQNHLSALNIAQRVLEETEVRFVKAQDDQIKAKQKGSEYSEAKSRYISAKRIFEAAQIKYSTELLERGIDFDPAKIWERAEKSLYPAKPNVPAYMALAALVGLVVGVGLAFFIEYLDTSVKTLDDVEKYLDIPVLAVIPKGVGQLIKLRGDTPDAEAYRILRANIEFNKPDRNANTFTLVSGGPGEGKSTTLNNLAFVCAQGGYNVLVVDADLRRPTQHRFFDQDNSVGLTDYLTGKASLDEITRTTKIDNLSFIPSGLLPGDAIGILNSQRMVDGIAKLKRQYDLVFFDAPPILGVSDGSVLASEVDMAVMVVQHRRFPRAMLQRVKQAVIHSGGTLVGVVLNNVDNRHDDGYSYYSSYNDYYAAPASKPEPRREPAGAGAVATVRPRHDGEDY
jgi:capsular exopolysaccharide synthesis family protein